MTTHENIAWPQLLSNPIVTAQHDNAGNRIAAATETFQRTVSEMVQALNDRAWLLANSAQFNAALRDVAAIRTILPRSGLGYVATRGVYCQQGRYAAAVAMYDQGLKAVPESDPYYQHLQQHRLTAININNKRVDFISRLPLDIVITNIVPRMEHRCYSDLPSEYLYVSHAWQERFLQQPNGLDFHFGTEEDTFKTGHFQLARFAPYVQKLLGVISGHAELKDLFSRGHFSNLKKLVLYCKSTTLRRPLVDGLRLVADSLTHLDIHGNSSIQLRDILESCPNLECLLTTYVDAVTPSSPSTRYPKMKRLALHSLSDTDITHHNMIDVLSRFPSLLSLEVNRVPECSVLRILHEHCPYLKILCLGVTYSPYDEMNVQPNRKGITWAYLAGRVGDVYMQDDLIMFLDQHKKSLEMIIIDARIKANNPGFQLSNGEIVEAGDYDPLAASTAPVVVEEDGTSDTLFTR